MGVVLFQIITGLIWLVRIFQWAILIRAVLSWFVRPGAPLYNLLLRFTEPLIAPFRPLAYKLTSGRMPIDLAPMICYFVLILLQQGLGYLRYYVL